MLDRMIHFHPSLPQSYPHPDFALEGLGTPRQIAQAGSEHKGQGKMSATAAARVVDKPDNRSP